MNDEILKLLDYSKLSDYRNELIKIIEYCWDIEHILGEKNNLNYDYFNSGINGFEQLRLLVDHSNNALMIVNILIEQIGYEGFENYKSNEKMSL